MAIDESKMQQGSNEQILSLDPAKPPTKFIPHAEFPRVIYKHPLEPFRTIEHRNAKHEVVYEEVVANEHLTQVVADQKEMEKFLASGWVKEPHVPKAPADPMAHVYASDEKRKPAK
jgi:hypothetical protein